MGIFADSKDSVFATYRCEIQFRNKVMGGVPRHPSIIESWLRTKSGLVSGSQQILFDLIRIMRAQGIEVGPDATLEEAMSAYESASRDAALDKQTNGFLADEKGGLYLESRQVKSLIREVTNVLYAGQRWGATKKGPKSFVAERVFVNPDELYLGVHEPSGTLEFVGHITDKLGPRSTVTKYQYVERARIAFTVMVLHNSVENQHWSEMWNLAEEEGLGALRSQGFGRFDVEVWEPVEKRAKVRA